MSLPRTDLAYERHGAKKAGVPGCHYAEGPFGTCRLHTLRIETEEAAKEVGCAVGTYRTLFFPPLPSAGDEEREGVVECLSSLLSDFSEALLGQRDGKGKRILVAGLGNRAMTADAVGPLAADEICATAHLRENEPKLLAHLGCAEIAVVTPGVMAQSGMESAALVKAAAGAFTPHLTILIDALAARSVDRLATTVQLSDTGLSPGAGIGNLRAAIDRQSLGCPIITIGTPTLTDAATLARDFLERIGAAPAEEEEKRLFAAAGGFFVCLRDADAVSTRYATVIARAINRAFGIPEL